MRSNFDDVGDFHEKFGLDSVTHHDAGPREVPDDLLEFRLKFLREELDEFEIAIADRDAPAMFDALIDLVYVALGTAQLCGFPWQDGWDEVQRSNMSKVRAAPDGSDSARRSAWDVVKPPGWVPPNIANILARYNTEFVDFTECPQCRRNIANNAELREVHVQTPFPRVDVHCSCGRALFSRAV